MYEIQADPASFNRAARALKSEDGGALLRRTAEQLGAAAAPGVGLVRSAVMAGGGGLPHSGEPLRSAIAAAVHQSVSISQHAARASILAMKTGMPRGFSNAPKRFNSRSFRHRVYGRDVWVTQIGAPGWFDNTLRADREKYRVAVRRALEDTAQSIARKA